MSAPLRKAKAATDDRLGAARPPVSIKIPEGAKLAGWGRLYRPGIEIASEDLAALSTEVPLFRGCGRSYGDSSLPPPDRPIVGRTTRADRLLAFDETTGDLAAEAGVTLRELNRLLLPRGWFTPVSPGTEEVTLGGMVAADVHGKSHHVDGSFGDHVRRLRMRVADGRILATSSAENPDLFRATIGGMGLTGHVLEVELRLKRVPSAYVFCETRPIQGLDEFQTALEESAPRWSYTVGWLDCAARGARLGRGILMLGRFAEPGEAPATPPPEPRRLRLPFDLPHWLLSTSSSRLLNAAYFHLHARTAQTAVVPARSFFYPLDLVHDWNRAYGRQGFTQYQCVVPREAGRSSVRRLVSKLVQLGGSSFLGVIKDLGRDGPGILSFCRPGITLALDIPVRSGTQQLIDSLNEQLIEDGGRIYLAKDAFTRPEHFRRMEPRLAEFQAVRDVWDPARRFSSAQAVRLLGG